MGISRKQSTPNFPKNDNALPPDTYTYVCVSVGKKCGVSGGKKCSFFGKFGGLCFLETSFQRFGFLPYYRQIIDIKLTPNIKIVQQMRCVILTCFLKKSVYSIVSCFVENKYVIFI